MGGTRLVPLGPAYRIQVWSTGAELAVTDPGCLPAAVDLLHAEIDHVDRLANRFRPDSEISRVNEAAGRAVTVSDDFIRVMQVVEGVARATSGAVDPTVGAALCRLGYDRDFSAIATGVVGQVPPPAAVPGWRSVEVDVGARTVALPVGAVLDLGVTAKALAADRIAAAVARLGCGALVALGGDVAVAGAAPDGGFSVGIGERWGDPSPWPAVAVASGGLATSGTAARRWRLGRTEVHHVIDPATGLPATEVWRTVTVAASTCVDANAASTAAVVKGAAAPGWLQSLGLPARLVGTDGTVVTAAGWPADDRHPVSAGGPSSG